MNIHLAERETDNGTEYFVVAVVSPARTFTASPAASDVRGAMLDALYEKAPREYLSGTWLPEMDILNGVPSDTFYPWGGTAYRYRAILTNEAKADLANAN